MNPLTGILNTDTIDKMGLKPSKNTDRLLERIMKMPIELRIKVGEGLDLEDLKSLNVALSSSKKIDPLHQTAWQQTIRVTRICFQKHVLANLIKHNPIIFDESWQKIGIPNRIFLLRVYEFARMHFRYFPKVIFLGKQMEIPRDLPTLLQDKEKLNKELDDHTSYHVHHKSCIEFPDSVNIIPRVDWIHACGNPSLSSFKPKISLIHLTTLDLSENNFTTPPTLENCPNLTHLDLGSNKLTTFPDIRKSLKLKMLRLSHNLLKLAKDTDLEHPTLEQLALGSNKFENIPSMQGLPKLTFLSMRHNVLVEAPNVKHNKLLQHLILNGNKITIPPLLDNHPNIQRLALGGNPFTSFPVIPDSLQILALTRFDCDGMSFEERIKKLANEKPNLHICEVNPHDT